MIRRLALTAGFAVLGAVAFAPSASAQTAETVPFEGTFGGTCTFSATTQGTLAQLDPNDEWFEASDGTGIGTTGAAGTTTVNCTSGGSLSVTAPTKTGGPAAFDTEPTYAVVFDGTNYTAAGTPLNAGWNRPTAPLNIPVAADTTLNVGMTAGQDNNGAGVPSGTYTYEVEVTATPN